MSENTKYHMVKTQIKDWIVTGKVQPGEKIHSENELVKMLGVSRHTVRVAIGQLVHEGWLYKEQGSGTFCSHHLQKETQVNGKNIGVITTYISDYIFPSIIRGIESYLTSKGYSLIMASTNNDIEKERLCLQTMMDKKIDGLIVEPTKSGGHNPNIGYYLNLEQKKVPYLMINQFYPELNPPHIMVDDEQGGYLATDHLITLGHQKIIGLFKSDDLQGVNRMKGFIRAFREHSLPFFPEMVVTYTTENRSTHIPEMVAGLLRGKNRPTGIVCYNDEVALQVLDMIRKLNLKVPEEISIVGYDDSHLAEASEVKLTSVTHPKMEMGLQAAQWIVEAVEQGKAACGQSTVYEPKLVVRTSTAQPFCSTAIKN